MSKIGSEHPASWPKGACAYNSLMGSGVSFQFAIFILQFAIFNRTAAVSPRRQLKIGNCKLQIAN
jgi:hypothetical protein